MGLIFDLDHTLYPDPENKNDLFAQAAARAAQSMGVNLPFDVLVKKAEDSGRACKSELAVFEKEHNLEPTELFLRYHDVGSRIFENFVSPNEGLAECFNRIVGSGERVVVLTHATRLWSERLMAKIGILDMIGAENILAQDHEAIGYLHKDKSEKPFNAAARHMNKDVRECTMFDDLAKNLLIPARLGMNTVRINWATQPDGPMPHIRYETDTAEAYLRKHVLPSLKRG